MSDDDDSVRPGNVFAPSDAIPDALREILGDVAGSITGASEERDRKLAERRIWSDAFCIALEGGVRANPDPRFEHVTGAALTADRALDAYRERFGRA